jgi:adenine-specific DNA methylase
VAQRGGADVKFDSKGHRIGGARLLAVVTLHANKAGRQYRIAADRDYAAVFKAMARLKKVAEEKLSNGLSAIPDEPTPIGGGSGAGRAFSVQKYGMMQFGDLFTARQKLGLCTLARFASGQTKVGTLAHCRISWRCSWTALPLATPLSACGSVREIKRLSGQRSVARPFP